MFAVIVLHQCERSLVFGAARVQVVLVPWSNGAVQCGSWRLFAKKRPPPSGAPSEREPAALYPTNTDRHPSPQLSTARGIRLPCVFLTVYASAGSGFIYLKYPTRMCLVQ